MPESHAHGQLGHARWRFVSAPSIPGRSCSQQPFNVGKLGTHAGCWGDSETMLVASTGSARLHAQKSGPQAAPMPGDAGDSSYHGSAFIDHHLWNILDLCVLTCTGLVQAGPGLGSGRWLRRFGLPQSSAVLLVVTDSAGTHTLPSQLLWAQLGITHLEVLTKLCCVLTGLLSLDPSGDPTALLASLTMGTEVEVQFGRSLRVRNAVDQQAQPLHSGRCRDACLG